MHTINLKTLVNVKLMCKKLYWRILYDLLTWWLSVELQIVVHKLHMKTSDASNWHTPSTPWFIKKGKTWPCQLFTVEGQVQSQDSPYSNSGGQSGTIQVFFQALHVSHPLSFHQFSTFMHLSSVAHTTGPQCQGPQSHMTPTINKKAER